MEETIKLKLSSPVVVVGPVVVGPVVVVGPTMNKIQNIKFCKILWILTIVKPLRNINFVDEYYIMSEYE